MEAPLKKKILIGLAITASMLLLAAGCWFFYFNSKFDVYQDDRYKFSIKYPKNWKVVIHPRDSVAVVFLRPKDTAMDTLQENFSVTVQPVPRVAATLSAFSAAIDKQMAAVFGNNINVIEDKSIQLGWREGHQMSFEAFKPDHLRMDTAWVLREDTAYIMAFLGDINKYDQDSLAVSEMIRSLKLQ